MNLFLPAAIIAFASISPAQAAPWIFTTSGIISSGAIVDTNASSFSDLSGKSFSISYTLDPATYPTQLSDSVSTYGFGNLSGSAFETVTIDGVSTTYDFDLSQFNLGFSGLVSSLANYNNLDAAFQYLAGTTLSGKAIESYSLVSSTVNPMGLGLSFDQQWSYNLQNGDFGLAYFAAFDTDGYQILLGDISTISIERVVVAIPEPETYAMLLAGLGLIGAVARRKIKRA